MKGTTKVAIAAGLLLLVGAAALWPTPRVAPEAPSAALADAASDRATAGRKRVQADDGAPAQEDVDAPVARAEVAPRATLRGVVADEQTRTPISGARVTTLARSAVGEESPTVVTTDASGRFELTVAPGRVLLLDGTSVPGAEVVAQAMTEGGNSARGTADAEGCFRILGVAPGPKTWLQGSKSGLVNALPAVAVVEGGRVTEGIDIRMRAPPIVTDRITSVAGAYRLHVRPSARAKVRARFTGPVAAGSNEVVVDVALLATGDGPGRSVTRAVV